MLGEGDVLCRSRLASLSVVELLFAVSNVWAFYGFSGTEFSQQMVYMKFFTFEQSNTWLGKWIYLCVNSRHEIIWQEMSTGRPNWGEHLKARKLRVTGHWWRNKAAQIISNFQLSSKEEDVENRVWVRRVSLENIVLAITKVRQLWFHFSCCWSELKHLISCKNKWRFCQKL